MTSDQELDATFKDPDFTMPASPLPDGEASTAKAEVVGVAFAANSKYRVGKRIAAGGMGAILSTQDLNCQRVVAMKVLLPDGAVETTLVERFTEEARITAQLEHPNIVPVHDVGADSGGRPYYTMKLVRGITLKSILEGIAAGRRDAVASYPITHLLTVFAKACDAVAFAHSRGVIHRDLKPENIMVGEFGEVLVMDWGLAKVLQGPKSDAESGAGKKAVSDPPDCDVGNAVPPDLLVKDGLTLEGQIMGTPAFMAPEQAQGRISELDARTDIYALGAILYTILVLRPPVSGDTVREILAKVTTGTIEPPTSFNLATAARAAAAASALPKGKSVADLQRRAVAASPAVPRQPEPKVLFPHCPGGRIPVALSAVAMKALSVDPGDRYQNVPDLQREIEAYRSGFATAAEDAGVLRQIALLVRRHKAVVSVSAAALLLLLSSGVYFMVRLSQKEARAVRAMQEARKNLADYRAEQSARAQLCQVAAPTFVERAERQMLENPDWKPALATVETALSLDPDLDAAWLLKGRLLLDTLALPAAKEAFAKARAVASQGTPVHARAKRCLDWVEATQLFLKEHGRIDADALSMRLGNELSEQLTDPLLAARFYARVKDSRQKNRSVLKTQIDAACERLLKCNPGLKMSECASALREKETTLRIESPFLRDLSPLAGIPFTSVALGSTAATPAAVTDLAPLKGMPLEKLEICSTGLYDFTPLRGMPLRSLAIVQPNLAPFDGTVLLGMPLKYLRFKRAELRDLRFLADLPLEELYLSECRSKSPTGSMDLDLAPLQGLPLRRLALDSSHVSSLLPVAKIRTLEYLDLWGASVTMDCSPLKGLPLKQLRLPGASIMGEQKVEALDLTPLTACPTLESVYISYTKKNLDALRRLPRLTRIGNSDQLREELDAVAFWRQYDAKKRP